MTLTDADYLTWMQVDEWPEVESADVFGYKLKLRLKPNLSDLEIVKLVDHLNGYGLEYFNHTKSDEYTTEYAFVLKPSMRD